MTLVSYAPNKKKVALAVSSFHKTGRMLSREASLPQKPEIILFYNKTKYGVDTFDQICRNYSVNRVCRRWPMRIFYGVLDQAGVISNIILNFKEENSLSRKDFLMQLGLDFIRPHLVTRLEVPTLRITIRELIRNILNKPLEREGKPIRFEDGKRNFCSCCPPDDKKRTIFCCSICERAACDEHRIHVCFKCRT